MSEQNPEFDLPTPEELGDLLPGYSQIEFFAQGGMAAIFKALQTSLDRKVAIKVLPREYGSDEAFRLRFEAEGKAMAKLNHPNLVSIFDFGEVDGLLYIVMEFVAGETLYQHSFGKPLPQLEAVSFARQVAEGLAHAHGLGILHRDIKPANVLLDEKDVPKLGDFGLAEGEEREEGDNLVFGTPGYTAPEVMANPTVADERADIFAVGVMLYELLTTKLPEKPYQAPSHLVKGNFRTDAVIQKAIQPNPAHRYQTAEELAKALKSLEDQLQKNSTNALMTAGAEGGAGPPRPANRPVIVAKQVGPDFTLIRNLIIIAGLILAIFVANLVLKSKKDEVAKKQSEIDQETVLNKKQTEAQKRSFQELHGTAGLGETAPLAAGSTTGQSDPTPKPEKNNIPQEVVVLTPAEELEELRFALAEGERTKFPKTTQQRAGSHFFFVEQAMTWHQASVFAEAHGAHLAIPATKPDVRWLGQEFPKGVEQIWLGGGAVARTNWAWFDPGIAFDLKEPNRSLGTAASSTNFGILKGAQPKEKFPFFIQWRSDGSNPGNLDNQLLVLKETLSESSPRWPAGTLILDGAHYLFIAREMSHDEARDFALAQGGHLAVASSEIEAAFFRDVVANCGLDSVWIGGQKGSADWAWVSGEPWVFARWADDFPTDQENQSALTLTSNGWQNRDPNEAAAGFLLEWSDHADSNESGGNTPLVDTNSELRELQSMARKLINTEVGGYLKKVSDNGQSKGSFMRSWLRGMAQEDSAKFQKIYDLYNDQIDDETKRLPSPEVLPEGSLPMKGKEILEKHFQTQKGLDLELKSASERLRSAYVSRIQAKIAELEGKGLKTNIPTLQKEIGGVGNDGVSFLEHFSASPFGSETEKSN